MGILSSGSSDQRDELQYIWLREIMPVGQINNCWTKYFRAFSLNGALLRTVNSSWRRNSVLEMKRTINHTIARISLQYIKDIWNYVILSLICRNVSFSAASFLLQDLCAVESGKNLSCYTSCFQRNCVHCSNVKFFKMCKSF